MKIKLGTLKTIIREVANRKRKHLLEMNRERLVKMFRQLGADIKALSVNSSKEEKDSIRQQVLSFPEPAMAERLSNFLNSRLERLEGAFAHVRQRPPARRFRTDVRSSNRRRRAG